MLARHTQLRGDFFHGVQNPLHMLIEGFAQFLDEVEILGTVNGCGEAFVLPLLLDRFEP